MAHSSWHAGTRSTPITVAVRRFTGHKYLLRLALITISHFFFHSLLGFTFLTLRLQTMEDKRDTKRTCSPSKEGSPSPSSAPTPPPAPSRSPPLLGSPPEVSSRRPRSPVFEQGSSPGRLQSWIFLHLWMKRVSSLIPHEMRSSPKIFLVTTTTTSSGRLATVRSLSSTTPTRKKRCARRMPLTPKLSTASTTDADEALKGMQDDNSDGLSPDQEMGHGNNGGGKACSP
jgi:hypothetical protein